jgi:hypothetical protein
MAIGRFGGDVFPGRRGWDLQFRNLELARIVGIEIQIEMLQDKFLRRRPDEKIDVAQPDPIRKNRRERDPSVRRRNFRFQGCFSGI